MQGSCGDYAAAADRQFTEQTAARDLESYRVVCAALERHFEWQTPLTSDSETESQPILNRSGR